jgi:50S ribosomal protein uL3
MEKTMSNSTPTPAAYRLGLVGRKVGMTRIFTEEGESIPVTVLDVSNNRVTQVKSPETDGYAAIQVAYGTRRASRVAKAQAGHYAKAGAEAGSILKEFRLDPAKAAEFTAGSVVAVESVFEAGQKVDVTGTTIGKGFAGTIKRHNFGSQRASHGNSRSHRVPAPSVRHRIRAASSPASACLATWVMLPVPSKTSTSCVSMPNAACFWSRALSLATRMATWSCVPPSRCRQRKEPNQWNSSS